MRCPIITAGRTVVPAAVLVACLLQTAAGGRLFASSSEDQVSSLVRVDKEENCLCFGLWEPSCGSNNVTFSNACLAHCNRVDVLCAGECPCARAPPAAAVQPKPAKVQPAKQPAKPGAKTVPAAATTCDCTAGGLNVCGENGVTYQNGCYAECNAVEIECEGRCPCDWTDAYDDAELAGFNATEARLKMEDEDDDEYTYILPNLG